MAMKIEIVEVGPRDGLPHERMILPASTKLELIGRAVAAGVGRIEVASFVHPRLVPQMADAEEVCASLPRRDDVTYIGLVLNERGLDRALKTQVSEVGAVASASDGFGLKNQGRSSDGTVSDAIGIIERAKAAGRQAQVTISVAFGCPFDGVIAPDRVVDIATRLAAAGPREIALGDTIGVASPWQVSALLRKLNAALPGMPFRVHFHDTRNTAVANAYAAIEQGVRTVDASVGGAGGCPFAPGATGNVATEDILFMLEGSGAETGVSRQAMADITPWLSERLGRPLPSRLAVAPPFPPEGGSR